MNEQTIHLIFHEELTTLLPKGQRQSSVFYPLNRRASIKDIIESMAIPHTEVGKIELEGRPLTFHHIPRTGEVLHIFPFNADTPILLPTVLRPDPFSSLSFIVDSTVGKLGRKMRMIGLDTSEAPDLPLTALATLADSCERVLISRNRDLLKCRIIRYGQLIRSAQPEYQCKEVFSRYSFPEKPRPFSRCLECNVPTEEITKEEVLNRLLPLTRKYYTTFRKCQNCDRIYWHGSHVEKMTKTIESFGQLHHRNR